MTGRAGGGALDGRRALVVGASRGIGAAIAERFAADGAQVTLAARDGDQLRGVATRLAGSGHTVVPADLSDVAGQARLADALAGATTDVVVLGLRVRQPWARVAQTSSDGWARALTDNTTYALRLVESLVPAQRAAGFGRWIALSSAVAGTGGAGQAAYVAQKCALEGLMRTLAIEEGRSGITANVVAPGFVTTEGTVEAYPPAVHRALSDANALGRAGTVREVAHVVAMLAHPDAGYVTGATVPVSGGVELGWPIAAAARAARSDGVDGVVSGAR